MVLNSFLNTAFGDGSFVFSGNPFDGIDVSAPGRQIVGNEAFIPEFDFLADAYQINAGDFGIVGDVNFAAVDANAPDAAIPVGANVITLLNSDNDGNPDTPFLAGTAANQIADLVTEDGAGLFVYFNSNLQLNRLVYSANLNDATADLKILSRQTDLVGPDAIDALGSFSTDNFAFEAIVNADSVLIGDDTDNILIGSDEQDFINGRGGDDFIAGQGNSDILTGGVGADTFAFSGDPFDGADVSAPARQIVGNEDFITDFHFQDDQYQINASDFGIVGDVNFAAVDANAPDAAIPVGANVITLLNSDNDGNPDTPFLAGTAANQIADLVTEDGAGLFVYFNSNLQLNRLVYSANLNDATADLKILSRQTDLVGPDAIDALGSFSAANFVFQDRDLNTAGGQQIIEVGVGETLEIQNFGGIGRGARPSRAVRNEIDTVQFIGEVFTPENLQLTQTGDDLSLTFEDDATNTQVVLKEFELENLDNLSRITGGNINRGNILFGDETRFEDSFDVFNADSNRNRLFNRNTVTFLNDRDNVVRGFSQSDDVINAQGGNDRIAGLSGDDLLRGDLGDDVLLGGQGSDFLRGGFGDDVLIGDDLFGATSGSDTFILATGEGSDLILDFEIGSDFIGLADTLSFEDLSLGGNTIRVADETVATLIGVDTATLDASTFVQV